MGGMSQPNERSNPPTQSVIVPFDFANESWKKEVIPGCFFVWFIEHLQLTVYGEVLANRGDLSKALEAAGYCRVRCYAATFGPAPRTTTMKVNDMTMLLSREQFDEARRLGWPHEDEEHLRFIFSVPPN